MHISRKAIPYPVLAFFIGVIPQLTQSARAETLLVYDFDDSSGQFENQPQLIASGLSAFGWTDQQSSLTDFAGNPGRALAARGFDLENRLELQLTIEPGQSLSIDHISFDQTASASGPSDWDLSINGQSYLSGVTTTSFTNELANLNLSGISDELLISIGGSGASSNRGTFRLDNFILDGSMHSVPIPLPAGLLLSGLIPLLRSRRRKGHN